MKSHWHEQIQRYGNGQSSAEEATALQAALNEDAELRALYLDYMNLDVALGAAAEMAAITGIQADTMVTFSQPPVRVFAHWRPLVAAAACAVLVVCALLPRPRGALRARPDFEAAFSSTQHDIARLSIEPASSFPAWMSPTASMIEQP